MHRLLLLTLSLLLFPNIMSRAIATNDFGALSKMEEDLRSTRARMSSGVWKLAVFHAGLQFYLAEGLQSDDACQYRKAPFVRQWASATPDSPGPSITDAALLLKQGWCFRGSGFTDSVPDDAWPKFRDAVTAASKTLETHGTIASVDPEFYAVKLDVLRGQSASRQSFRAVIDEATNREPDYHRTYFNAVWYYLPQWGGSYAEVEQFARYAAERPAPASVTVCMHASFGRSTNVDAILSKTQRIGRR